MNERLDYSEFDTDYWLSRNSRALRRCAATISPRSQPCRDRYTRNSGGARSVQRRQQQR